MPESWTIRVTCTAGHPDRRTHVAYFDRHTDLDGSLEWWDTRAVTSRGAKRSPEMGAASVGTDSAPDAEQFHAELFEGRARVARKAVLRCDLCGLTHQRRMDALTPLLEELWGAKVSRIELAHLKRVDLAWQR